MTMALTLLFVAFGIPLLTTLLITGYELFTHFLKPSKQPAVSSNVPSSVTIHAGID